MFILFICYLVLFSLCINKTKQKKLCLYVGSFLLNISAAHSDISIFSFVGLFWFPFLNRTADDFSFDKSLKDAL